MFESGLSIGSGVDYGYLERLVPGALDPVRLAALVAGFDAGGELLDPEEFALFGPEPGVDPAAWCDRVEAAPPLQASVAAGPVEPAVLVPSTVPGLEDMAPGATLAQVLEGVDLTALGAYEVVEAVAGWQWIASWAAAGQAAAVTELARRAEMRPLANGQIESMSPQRVTGMEVAARLQLTPAAGEALVARSLCLTEVLPGTLAALAAGRIDMRRAEVVADELRRHDPAVARQVEADVLPRAEHLTAPRLRRAVRQSLHRLAPATVEERREAAAAKRHVQVIPAADGMAWLEAYLPAQDAAAVEAAVEAAAAAMKRQSPGDGRTKAQRRADALAQMGWIALSTGRLGGCVCGQRLDDQHRRPVAVQVTVAMTTLLGLDDHPGELAGYGPITAEVARRLAAEGTWRRLLTDPASGAVLDYGRTRYTPPPELVDHVVARDRTCRWPTCDRPAAAGEIDHTLRYPFGATAADDLGAFCKAHHIGKHHSRWRVKQPAPGQFQWITPTGHIYTVEPEPVGPVEPAVRVGAELVQPEPARAEPAQPEPPAF
ncbi:MAG: DUF222 domain-containing protein [Jiangellaceae bacterium]